MDNIFLIHSVIKPLYQLVNQNEKFYIPISIGGRGTSSIHAMYTVQHNKIPDYSMHNSYEINKIHILKFEHL